MGKVTHITAAAALVLLHALCNGLYLPLLAVRTCDTRKGWFNIKYTEIYTYIYIHQKTITTRACGCVLYSCESGKNKKQKKPTTINSCFCNFLKINNQLQMKACNFHYLNYNWHLMSFNSWPISMFDTTHTHYSPNKHSL